MPLPNYGYYNKEKKEKQQFKYEMAPEYVDVEDEDSLRGTGRKESRKKGRVTTGTIDIDLERKLVMHKEKDANIWKPPEIDHKEVEECKKFKAPAHQNLKREVRSTLDSLISGNKAKQLQTTKDSEPKPLPRTSLPTSSASSSFQPLNREITKTGVSIQPKGTYQLNSKKSLGSFSDNDNKVSATTSSYSYSMSSSSASFRY